MRDGQEGPVTALPALTGLFVVCGTLLEWGAVKEEAHGGWWAVVGVQCQPVDCGGCECGIA
jgi:hypothetical protein